MAAGRDGEVELVPAQQRSAAGKGRHVVLLLLLLLVLLALGFLLVGVGLATRRVPRAAATIVLVIDVSGSMKADDVVPGRMTAAKRAAGDFVSALPPKLRVGVVGFSSVPRLLEGPTGDRRAVLAAIDSLVAEGGTAMGDAIALGIEAATAEGDGSPATVLLLSDGVNTLGHMSPLDAAEEAGRLEVPVYTISFGTDEGHAMIPDGRGGSRRQNVPPDPVTLSNVAALTDGRFYRAPSAEELAEVYHDIGRRVGYRTDATRWPLAVGAGLLVLSAALSLLWRRQLRGLSVPDPPQAGLAPAS